MSDAPRCSAKGCRADATIDLTWRNPRLHDAARRKHWLACADHTDHLADFLSRRGFLLDRGPLGLPAQPTVTRSDTTRSDPTRPTADTEL